VNRPEPTLWIESGDVGAMIALQDRIEAGESFVMPRAPEKTDTGMRVPITKIS
jgi:hypothetical protein